MEHKEERKEAMTFVGMGVDTSVQECGKVCPKLWENFMKNYEKIKNPVGGMKNYGVSLTKSIQECSFRYIAATQVSEVDQLPEGMEKVEVPAANYLIFEHKGKMDKLGETYCQIMKFIPTTGKKQNPDLWIEFYDYRWKGDVDESIMEIWVPLKE